MHTSSRPKKTFKGYRDSLIPLGDLLDFQRRSYDHFLNDSLGKLFQEFFPINDHNHSKFSINFVSYKIDNPKHTPEESKRKLIDYSAPLKVTLELENKITKKKKIEEVNFGEVPIMTEQSSFIINGVEKVVISQLIKSSGIFFQKAKGQTQVFGAKIVPTRSKGVWIEFESDSSQRIFVKIDQRKKFPVTMLLRAFGLETKESVLSKFSDGKEKDVIKSIFAVDDTNIMDDVYNGIYKNIRSGEPASAKAAKEVIDKIFSEDRLDISEIGRKRFNRRMGLTDNGIKTRTITLDDVIFIVKEIIRLNNSPDAKPDDIDHLSTRRVRLVGELFESKIRRKGLSNMKRNTQDRMSTTDPTKADSPSDIINQRLFQATVREFFNVNQLSQLLKQANILDEIEHFRTITALGEGGVKREHAGFDVRDIHPSHYGRICPIHTPEGQNIGLVLHLSSFARINDEGIIEAPYAVVKNSKITDEIKYLTADEEDDFIITHAAVELDGSSIKNDFIYARKNGNFSRVKKEDVNLIDIATGQPFSIATSLVPFLHHNIAVRTSYGSTMQRQALPLLNPEEPFVATGYEELVARATGRVLVSENEGEVIEVDANHITLKTRKGEVSNIVKNLNNTSSIKSSLIQRPIVSLGDKVEKGDVLADCASTNNGQVSLGKNLRIAYLCYNGMNFEDAIVISRRLVQDDTLTSIYTYSHMINVRDTKLGPEATTSDIANVSEHRLRNLDQEGVIRVGSDVYPGDILVGKVMPRGESQLSAEERLLQSIFGDKAKDMKDTSYRLPPGKKGRVIDVQILDRAQGYALEPDVIKQIRITVAELRKIREGDKLANRYGNKGVISKILPEEDMPYTEGGEPVDIVLTPLGVVARNNIGQILETHLGLAANTLNYQVIVPPVTSVTEDELKDELKKAGYDESGKVDLYDGRTGEKFRNKVTVGYSYIMKLNHMVEDKVHARSIGKYALITQQPLGGRSLGGGQRLGEMEVWALLGHGAAYTLREMLTIKSDDIQGRSSAYGSIIKGEPITQTNTPAAFNALMYYLRGLSLDVSLNHERVRKTS